MSTVTIGIDQSVKPSDADSLESKVNHMRNKNAQGGAYKLGTIKGVFVPTFQNIMGIILFLRLPWITGQAGIGQALAVVLSSCLASCLTSLSMSAVATNGKPQSGGCYSIIKSSLGPEFGGTVGLLLFLSNTFGVAMYVLGSVEILKDWQPDTFGDLPNQVLGAIILAGLFTVVFVGIKYISRTALLFLFMVILAVSSIYAGVVKHAIEPDLDKGIVGFSAAQFRENFGSKYTMATEGRDAGTLYNFPMVLSIFFPAVTDPLAGSNLSGDLKDPQKSIPPGTLAAVFVTTLIFSGQVIMCGSSVLRDTLISDKLIVARLAWPFQELIYLGMLFSTMGAGLQSLAGAPRLLAGIGRDRLIPQLGFLAQPGKEPRYALIVCAVGSLGCIMIGRLDGVAPFITMWFLTCYGIINGACFYVAYEHSPTFRPSWKYYDWRLSLLGFLQCTFMMFLINWFVALSAWLLAAVLYKYIQYNILWADRAHEAATGEVDYLDAEVKIGKVDWRAGRRFSQARSSLLALKDGDLDFKYWRPFILFLAKMDRETEEYVPQRGMINLISQMMKRGKGLSVVAGVVEGDFVPENHRLCQIGRTTLVKKLKEKNIEGFADMVIAKSELEGHQYLLHAKGLGPMRPNTALIGWPTEEALNDMPPEKIELFSELVSNVRISGKSCLLCHAKPGCDFPTNDDSAGVGFIDVWWVFDLFPANGLLLLIPFLLQQHRVWKNTTTRLFVVALPDTDLDELHTLLQGMVDAGGMRVVVEVLHMETDDAPRFAENAKIASTRSRKAHASQEALKEFNRDQTGYNNPGGEVTVKKAVKLGNMDVVKGESKETELSVSKTKGKKDRPSVAGIESDSEGSKMTGLLTQYSGQSPLVLMTMPKQAPTQTAPEWVKSVNALVSGLKRVVLVQESGMERIQFYSE